MSRPESWPLTLVLGSFVLLAGMYSIVVPPFESPDEIWHFAFIQHVATGQGLPVSAPNTPALWRQQGVQAPGYYLAVAALTFWIDQSDFPRLYEQVNPHAAIGQPDALINRNVFIHHSDERWPWRGAMLALHIARFCSIGLGVVTLWATYRTLALLLGASGALVGTAFIAFIPQFLFISASANNDNAINALAALVVWRLVESGLRAGLRPAPTGLVRRRDIALGCLLGLALLTKLSALGLVLLAGMTLLLAAWRVRSWRHLIGSALGVGLPALAISGWWYVRNALLYGDPLAWNMWQANILLRVAPADWRTIASELESLERSFWGLFGWLNVDYPAWVYAAFRALEAMLGLGLLVNGVRRLRHLRRLRTDWRWAGGGVLVLWLALLIVSWLRFMRIAPAAQGRYFFAAAPSLALLMILGWQGFSPPRFHRTSAIWTPPGWLTVAGLALLSAATPFCILQPAYQPPPSAPISSAGRETSSEPGWRAELGDQFAILGIAAEPGQVTPGGTAAVTIVWQALAPSSTDYSVFVHLVNEEGLTVAQADTMPGGGLLPTSQWTPGQKRAERYQVTIPSTAYAPDRGLWAVGLYDHRSGQRLPMRLMTASGQAEVFVAEESLRFGVTAIVPRPGEVPNPIGVDFLDNVTLAGYEFSSRSLRPGETLTVTLYWQARGPVEHDYTTFAHLLDATYETYGGHDSVPQPPTATWQPGPIVSDIHTFGVAPDAPPGFYQVEVGLYTRPDFERLRLAQATAAEGTDRLLMGPLRVVPP